MCRIMFSRAIEADRKKLQEAYYELKVAAGGDGNGIAYVDQEGKMQLKKGVDLTTLECADLAITSSSQTALFHTRKVSSGYISDGNCQPFNIDGEIALAHNGHWKDYKAFLAQLVLSREVRPSDFAEWSDSRVVAYLMQQKHIGLQFLSAVDEDVWLLWNTKTNQGNLFLYDGSFRIGIDTEGIYWYASQLPTCIDYQKMWLVDDNTHIVLSPTNGFEVIKGKVRLTLERGTSSYYGGFYNATDSRWPSQQDTMKEDPIDASGKFYTIKFCGMSASINYPQCQIHLPFHAGLDRKLRPYGFHWKEGRYQYDNQKDYTTQSTNRFLECYKLKGSPLYAFSTTELKAIANINKKMRRALRRECKKVSLTLPEVTPHQTPLLTTTPSSTTEPLGMKETDLQKQALHETKKENYLDTAEGLAETLSLHGHDKNAFIAHAVNLALKIDSLMESSSISTVSVTHPVTDMNVMKDLQDLAEMDATFAAFVDGSDIRILVDDLGDRALITDGTLEPLLICD